MNSYDLTRCNKGSEARGSICSRLRSRQAADRRKSRQSRYQITRAGGRESQGQINSPRSYTEGQ